MQGEHGVAGGKHTLWRSIPWGFPGRWIIRFRIGSRRSWNPSEPRDSLGERIEDEMERPGGTEYTPVWVAWFTRGKELVPLVRQH